MTEQTFRTTPDTNTGAPFVVAVAALIGFAKALFQGILGVIGVLEADTMDDRFSALIIVYALVTALASWLLLKGSNVARHVTGILSLLGGVVSVAYAFSGPPEALVPGLVGAGMSALVLWLLYGTAASRRYFT